ncbi:MAG: hypothetical protein KDB88_13320 [Flavobacteriales bacterium]|nr:hypothetical protein [Flavobacteriales bacterium]
MIRTLLLTLATVCSLSTIAQATIYSYAVGNWRNGPTVYISPLITATEALSDADLIAHYKKGFPEFRTVTEIDVLRFATREEGEEARLTLARKYGMRQLPVVMVEVPEQH